MGIYNNSFFPPVVQTNPSHHLISEQLTTFFVLLIQPIDWFRLCNKVGTPKFPFPNDEQKMSVVENEYVPLPYVVST